MRTTLIWELEGLNEVVKYFNLDSIWGKSMICQRRTPLDAAVTHMTQAAQSEGRDNLIMTTDEWKQFVLSNVKGGVREFGVEIVNMSAGVESIDTVNVFVSLAMNIWNAMPETIRRLGLRRIEQDRLNYYSQSVKQREIV